MRQVTAIHLVGGTQHEHIASVKWRNTSTGTADQSTRQQMVEYINGSGQACVTDGVNTVSIGVVKATTPYIRTHADGKWTDNLLALPRY